MARIYPFRALRYNPSQVRVEDCVTQPYDKITPAMQQSYYARSPYNLVRVILGLPELFDEAGVQDVYTRAARDFGEWRASGALAQEPEPCLFAYSQCFTLPGANGGPGVERRGLIALGAVSPYSEGVVFRHEQTHTRARTDRLNLLRATRAHFGQIFMLYSDPAQTVESLMFPKSGAFPDIEVRDELGVLHRVWRVNDPATINMVQGALESKKLIIADGHHRYETAMAYAAEHAPATTSPGSRSQPPYPEAAVMMTLVNMDGEGLHILPTHRIVHGVPNFSAPVFREKLASVFSTVQPLSIDPRDADGLLYALKEATAAAGAGGTTMLAVLPGEVLALSMDNARRADALSQAPERRRRLDVVVLHDAVFAGLLGIDPEAVRTGEYVRYAREAAEAIAPVLRGEAQAAFLVNPVTLTQLRDNTFAGEVMPQKSTDFYPKLLSGLAVYALDEHPRAQR